MGNVFVIKIGLVLIVRHSSILRKLQLSQSKEQNGLTFRFLLAKVFLQFNLSARLLSIYILRKEQMLSQIHLTLTD